MNLKIIPGIGGNPSIIFLYALFSFPLMLSDRLLNGYYNNNFGIFYIIIPIISMIISNILTISVY